MFGDGPETEMKNVAVDLLIGRAPFLALRLQLSLRIQPSHIDMESFEQKLQKMPRKHESSIKECLIASPVTPWRLMPRLELCVESRALDEIVQWGAGESCIPDLRSVDLSNGN
jgi:hypothetical protein